MRNTILTSVVSTALFGIAFQSIAFSATERPADHQAHILVTAGQGGSYAIEIPTPVTSAKNDVVAARQGRAIEVTVGNGGALSTFVPADKSVTTPDPEMASIDGD